MTLGGLYYCGIIPISLLPPCGWSSSTVSIFRWEVWQSQQFDTSRYCSFYDYLEAEPAFSLSAMSAIPLITFTTTEGNAI